MKEIGKKIRIHKNKRAEANKVEHRTEWKESKLNALWYFFIRNYFRDLHKQRAKYLPVCEILKKPRFNGIDQIS